MTLPVDVDSTPNYTAAEHADHHNDLHAERNTPTHAHSVTTVWARFVIGAGGGDFTTTSTSFADVSTCHHRPPGGLPLASPELRC